MISVDNSREQHRVHSPSFRLFFTALAATLAVLSCGNSSPPGGGDGGGGGSGPDTSKQGTWTPLPAISPSAFYYGVSFAVSADSKKVVVGGRITGEQFNILSDSGKVWEKRSPPTGSDMYYLRGLASSADGGKLASTFIGGNIYTSDNSGATWTNISPPDGDASGKLLWDKVVSSADGSRLVTFVGGNSGGHIYTYSDSGKKWTDRTKSPGQASGNVGWTAIACSIDCTRIAATSWGLVRNPSIYTSDDFGETWHDRSLTNNNLNGFKTFTSIASSSDGKFLVATAYWTTDTPAETQISLLTSDNYGSSWTAKTPPELSAKLSYYTNPFLFVTSSNDGSRIALAALVGTTSYVFTSSDYGNKWTKQTLPEIPSTASKTQLIGGYPPYSDGSTLTFAQLEYPPESVDTKNNTIPGNLNNVRMYTLNFP